MIYFLDGKRVNRSAALVALQIGANRNFYDFREAAAVWARAHESGQDAEAARDELYQFCDSLELFPESTVGNLI